MIMQRAWSTALPVTVCRTKCGKSGTLGYSAPFTGTSIAEAVSAGRDGPRSDGGVCLGIYDFFMGWQKDAPMSTGLGNASSDQTSSMACCSRLRVHSRTAYCHDECVSHCRAALVTRKAPIRTPWRRCLVESQDSSP
jgi:hypothetical protein